MTEIIIKTRIVRELETLIDDGLLTEASLFDGEAAIEIVFLRGRKHPDLDNSDRTDGYTGKKEIKTCII